MGTTTIIPEKRLVIFEVDGELTVEVVINTLQNGLQSNSDYKPGFNILWDFRGVTTVKADKNDVYRLRELMIQSADLLGKGIKSAQLSSSDLVFGFTRMYDFVAEDKNLGDHRAFRDYDEAYKWLTT